MKKSVLVFILGMVAIEMLLSGCGGNATGVEGTINQPVDENEVAGGSSGNEVFTPADSSTQPSTEDNVPNSQNGDVDPVMGAPECSVVSCGEDYGAEYFVSPKGSDANSGTVDSPFATLERARGAVRTLKQSTGLPAGGVVIWLQQGIYTRTATFNLTSEDSGEEGKPIVYRAWPGDEVRVAGAKQLLPSWFSLVDSSSPVFDRLDGKAQGYVKQVNLPTHGIHDYGQLSDRGFNRSATSALELFFNSKPMQLARWPDKGEISLEAPQTYTDESITLYGQLQPDVSGQYTKTGISDGVNAYQRQGLVNGKQYYLYRESWRLEDSDYISWFITTSSSGHTGNSDPWWYRESPRLGVFTASDTAQGSPTTINPARKNYGFVSIEHVVDDTSFNYAGTRPQRWSQANDIWLHGYWKYMWADQHVKAVKIDNATKTINLTQTPVFGIQSGYPFYAYNLLEEITQPGEWYLDRGTGNLYLWPPEDMGTAEIYVSMLADQLVKLTDTNWVTFQGIVFEMARGSLVEISGGTHNRLYQSVLRNSGNDGALISGVNNGIDRSELYDIGETGVIVKGGYRASLSPSGNYVANCNIHDFGRWVLTYRPAVKVSGVGNKIAHNRLYDAPHAAITYAGNDHMIEYNDIHDVCRYSSDAGAIYSGRDWGWRGNVIQYNFIHNLSGLLDGYGVHGVHGVYLDDTLSGIKVFGNIFYKITGFSILSGGGRDNLMENNIMAHCGKALYTDSRGIKFINNKPGDGWNILERLTWDGVQYQQEPWASRYPALANVPNSWDILSDTNLLWLYPQGSVFSRNLAWDCDEWIHQMNYEGTGTLNKYAEVADNVFGRDPKFLDEAGGDLSLSADSPAFLIPNFENIPFSQIGIQP